MFQLARICLAKLIISFAKKSVYCFFEVLKFFGRINFWTFYPTVGAVTILLRYKLSFFTSEESYGYLCSVWFFSSENFRLFK